MLKELLEKNRVEFYDSFTCWQDAIHGCCHALVRDGTVTEDYAEAIIDNVLQYGTYIVIDEDLAIPHTMLKAHGVNGNGICFAKVREPVEFEPGNPEKNARLIFTLAACDRDEHYVNMRKLGKMLLNPEVLKGLKEADSVQDVQALSLQLGI